MFLHFLNFFSVYFCSFCQIFEGNDAEYKSRKRWKFASAHKGAKILHVHAKFHRVRNFRIGANFRTNVKFSHSTATPFCFDHNFFIRTPFWAILVPLESLESIESKNMIERWKTLVQTICLAS